MWSMTIQYKKKTLCSQFDQPNYYPLLFIYLDIYLFTVYILVITLMTFILCQNLHLEICLECHFQNITIYHRWNLNGPCHQKTFTQKQLPQ